MAEQQVQRRLAAILVADVVGYSRLMGADETGTLVRLKSIRDDLIDPKVKEHEGRVVKLMGDGILIEFPSVFHAVQNAVEIQLAMRHRNADAPEEIRIEFRVGINLGDVIVEDDDIYGDGVNVAARLEGLAEPGSVCISRNVHEQVRGKLDIDWKSLGPQQFKNIAEPVEAYSVQLTDIKVRHDSPVDVSTPVPGFGGRPAIAVLAFDNMSGDPEQEYFADGIAEDILTRLATWRWIPVIARNSSFTYKGRAVDVKAVGRELGVRYVLEGSVRKVGNRVRVTGQLIDAEAGNHVWADNYDGDVSDIFALQDKITESVVTSMEPAIGKAEIRRARAKEPENLDAWEIVQRANWHFHRFTREDFAESLDLYQQAIALDPDFSQADSMLAFAYYMRILLSWSDDPAAEMAEMHRSAQNALSRDDMDPIAHAALGLTNIIMRDYDAGLERLRRSIELNPSYVMGHFILGAGLTYASRPADGIPEIEIGIRLSPHDSMLITWLTSLALSHYQLRNYENALEVATRAEQIAPQYPLTHHALASALGQLGRVDEARRHLDEFLRLSPGYSYETAVAAVPFKEPADMEHFFEGIRKAGWKG